MRRYAISFNESGEPQGVIEIEAREESMEPTSAADPEHRAVAPIETPNGLRVKELREWLAQIPDTNSEGNPSEVWLSTGRNLSSQATGATVLNFRYRDGQARCDVLLEPSDEVWETCHERPGVEFGPAGVLLDGATLSRENMRWKIDFGHGTWFTLSDEQGRAFGLVMAGEKAPALPKPEPPPNRRVSGFYGEMPKPGHLEEISGHRLYVFSSREFLTRSQAMDRSGSADWRAWCQNARLGDLVEIEGFGPVAVVRTDLRGMPFAASCSCDPEYPNEISPSCDVHGLTGE